jgi:hypothetical protein
MARKMEKPGGTGLRAMVQRNVKFAAEVRSADRSRTD